jgi:hypothetical protein
LRAAAEASAAPADSAFLRACFAAFLASLESLRAFLSHAFADRTCFLASSARRAALRASELSRLTVAPGFGRADEEGLFATVCSGSVPWVVELNGGDAACHGGSRQLRAL